MRHATRTYRVIVSLMATFLVKTEPGEYSFDDLVRDGRCVWSGVKNPGALVALRAMKRGDRVLVYHTGDVKAIVGEAKVVSSGAYEDPSKPGLNDKGEVKWAVVDLAPVAAWEQPVELAVIKADARLKELGLVKQGRLSVMRVGEEVEKVLRAMAK